MNEIYTEERRQAGSSVSNYPISTSDWFLTILITAIPVVGIVMLFVWAFGNGTNPNKANWAKASLLWVLIGTVIAALFMALFFAAIFSRYSSEM
ncbi:MAG TPA: hypothetical protein VHO03_07820 [Ignavibacteriales bacterium]|nr:hypothetical protein [Ignavibacteriales bacterium]